MARQEQTSKPTCQRRAMHNRYGWLLPHPRNQQSPIQAQTAETRHCNYPPVTRPILHRRPDWRIRSTARQEDPSDTLSQPSPRLARRRRSHDPYPHTPLQICTLPYQHERDSSSFTQLITIKMDNTSKQLQPSSHDPPPTHELRHYEPLLVQAKAAPLTSSRKSWTSPPNKSP
jgi:hypothetical protein